MKRKVKEINMPNLTSGRDRTSKANYEYLNLIPSTTLLEFAKNKKYYIRTYGCQGNIRDSEVLSGLLENAGFKECQNPEESDVVIINTCAVRENAEDKVYGEIGILKNIKEKINKNLIIAICGCMMEEEHIASLIKDKFRHVDIVFGTHDIAKLYTLLDEVISHHSRVFDVTSKAGDVIEGLPSNRMDKYKAFVNIMYGCNKFCTYCIVPYTRGKERSRKEKDILKECEELVKAGYQEITLLGQNVNAYGKDLDEGIDFAMLLEDVAKLHINRLRFMTSHPYDFNEKMLDVIAKYPNIMKCIHLPVQSGNSHILSLMGRRYDREQYIKLVNKMREIIPNVAITTDIIVGFPNETYEEFLDTVSLVKEVSYDSAFTFIYSPRKGTPAARMVDNVTDKEKHDRFNELALALDETIRPKNLALIGTIQNVLVDGFSKKDKNLFSGYLENNKVCNFINADESDVGKIIKVKITDAKLYSLTGEKVNG